MGTPFAQSVANIMSSFEWSRDYPLYADEENVLADIHLFSHAIEDRPEGRRFTHSDPLSAIADQTRLWLLDRVCLPHRNQKALRVSFLTSMDRESIRLGESGWVQVRSFDRTQGTLPTGK